MPSDPASAATTSPIYLDASSILTCLSDQEIYEVVSKTVQDLNSTRLVKGPKVGFGLDIHGEHLHVGSMMGCVLSSSAVGVKWFTVSDKNPSRGLPRVPNTILISDAETGLLRGVLDSTQLTNERTAAYAVAAATAFARRPLKEVAVIGAGGIGQPLVKFLLTTQTVDRVTVASRKESSARSACDAAAASLRRDVSLFATSDVHRAVRNADLVFTCTGVPEDTDLVRSEWLKDDAIVCSVGSRREVDLQLLSEAWIVVDDAAGLTLRRSDFREGGVGWGRIAGDLGSVMSGQLQLPATTKKIHLILVGLAVLDVALGASAIANAREKGLGLALEPGRH